MKCVIVYFDSYQKFIFIASEYENIPPHKQMYQSNILEKSITFFFHYCDRMNILER